MIKRILNVIKAKRESNARRIEWRTRNPKNFTTLHSIIDMDRIRIGDYTYGKINCMCYGKGADLKIGRYCSIAQEVMFILNADHNVNLLSTYPFESRLNLGTGKQDLCTKGDIIIDDDVWIGYRSTVLSGVHIGQGAIVSAGSVVTKDVPPYAIVGGVPAKVIKYRFDYNTIIKLLKIDYSKIEPEFIKQNAEIFYTKIDENNIDSITDLLPAPEKI